MHRSVFIDTCITVLYICFLGQIFLSGLLLKVQSDRLKFGNGKYLFKLSCSCAATTIRNTTAVEFLFLELFILFLDLKTGKTGNTRVHFGFSRLIILLKGFVADFIRKW